MLSSTPTSVTFAFALYSTDQRSDWTWFSPRSLRSILFNFDHNRWSRSGDIRLLRRQQKQLLICIICITKIKSLHIFAMILQWFCNDFDMILQRCATLQLISSLYICSLFCTLTSAKVLIYRKKKCISDLPAYLSDITHLRTIHCEWVSKGIFFSTISTLIPTSDAKKLKKNWFFYS